MQRTLRSIREENKKTVAEVAKVLGTSETAVYLYESGKRKISLDQVLALSQFYDDSAEEIIKAQLNSRRGQ